jgi:hypothetical protein
VLSLHRRSSQGQAAFASFAADNPAYFAQVLAAIESGSGSLELKVRLIRHHFKLFGAYQSAMGALRQGELLVLEEGFCQRLIPCATEAGGPGAPSLTDCIAAMPRASGVVVVRANEETCLQRLRERGWPGFLAGRGPAEREAWLRSAALGLARIVAELGKAGFSVTEVSNEGPLEMAEHELETAIKSFLEDAGCATR